MPTTFAALVHQRASRSVHLCGALKEALLSAGQPALARIAELVEDDAAAALAAVRLHASRKRRGRVQAVRRDLGDLALKVGPSAHQVAVRMDRVLAALDESPGD